jgi:hypothetical protein
MDNIPAFYSGETELRGRTEDQLPRNILWFLSIATDKYHDKTQINPRPFSTKLIPIIIKYLSLRNVSSWRCLLAKSQNKSFGSFFSFLHGQNDV